MASKRSKQGTTGTEANDTTTARSNTMAGLSPEQIQALLGKTRQKGLYTQFLNEFVQSGEMGVCANEQWVELRDKKATTLKQGFEGAKEKKEAVEGSDQVKVVANEEQVYLINLRVAGEQLGVEAAAVS